MELTITFQHGPLDAEFTGEDREEIQQDLLQFVDFLEENAEQFEGIEPPESDSEEFEEPGLDSDRWEEDDEESENSSTDSADDDHPLSTLSRKTNTTVERLDEFIYVDPDGEEDPQLRLDNSDLGESTTERQRNAAYVILRVWEECYGEERMKTSRLKNILTMSGISDENLYNAWKGPGKGDFDPTGSGPSATVGLKGPGERQALKVIRQLAEESSE